MNLKIAGLILCLAALGGALWIFSPALVEERENAFPPAPLEVRTLLVKKSDAASVEPISPKDPQGEEKPSAPALPKTALSNQEIEEELSHLEKQFQNCWMQRLKDQPDLKGKVLFRLTLSPRGKINETQLVESTIKDTLMLQCLNSTLSRASFREFQGDPIEILFPLSFE